VYIPLTAKEESYEWYLTDHSPLSGAVPFLIKEGKKQKKAKNKPKDAREADSRQAYLYWRSTTLHNLAVVLIEEVHVRLCTYD
jgi:hypothetical protein